MCGLVREKEKEAMAMAMDVNSQIRHASEKILM